VSRNEPLIDGLASARQGDAVTARKALLVVAIMFAIGEGLDSIDVGWVGIFFSVLWAIGALLLRRGGRAGVVLVGVLMVLEVVAWPSFDRKTTTDWIIQTPFLILGLVGLGVLAVVLFRGLQAGRAPRPG
jgi:hypothetical protein